MPFLSLQYDPKLPKRKVKINDEGKYCGNDDIKSRVEYWTVLITRTGVDSNFPHIFITYR